MNTVSNLTLAVFGLGSTEMLLIFAIVILLFGAKKLPELAKGLGKSIKEFKKASTEDDADDASTPAKKPAAKEEIPKTHGN
ncbi:MAG TPA: twin-arginine translocase TatA/TatE family subunit [Rariglobus sp.]